MKRSLFLGAACALAVSAAPAQESGLGGGRYDGVWAFASTTTSGSCPSIAPADVTIQGGRVVSANGGGSEPWGYVENDGTFVARFTTGDHVSRANGVLRGDSGTGAWSSSTDFCGGAWRAQRSGRAKR